MGVGGDFLVQRDVGAAPVEETAETGIDDADENGGIWKRSVNGQADGR